jgi:hypothetical protein
MNEVLILAARRYDFERDGRRVQGCELTYVQRDADGATNRRGHSPLKVQAPISVWEQLVQVPGIYDLELRFRPGRDNKAEFSVTGAQYLGAAQIFTLGEGQSPPSDALSA